MRLRFALLVFLTVGLILVSALPAISWAQSSETAQVATPSSDLPTSPSPTPTPEPPEQSLNLTVSPISVLLEVNPGEAVTGSMRILNNGTEVEELQLELATFSADSGGSKPIIRPFEPHEAHQSWLVPESRTVSVSPGEWKTISLTFSPPKEAALTYYYAVIVNRQANAELEGGGTVIAGAPAVLVLATVNSPNAKQELQLVSFKSPKKVYEFLPAEFEVQVENTGNVHLAPLGNVFIDGGGKKDIGILSFNQASGLVLPDTTRTYTVRWEEGFPFYETVSQDGVVELNEDGTVKRKLNWDLPLSKLRFGKYTAHLLMVYDNGDRDVPVESTLTFWVVPWRFLAVAGVILLLAANKLIDIVRRVIRIPMRLMRKQKEVPPDVEL